MPKTLLLIDGSNYLFRAFHALPDLRTSAGEPTGAIKGFTAMLGAVRAIVKPDFGVCVFDAKGKTFRNGIYPEYKANRPPTPEDLACQISPIFDFVRAMGWTLIQKSGVEADDVIGTLAVRAKTEGIRSVIATGDKDLNQLVEDGAVTTINTMSHEVLDEAGVTAKFGVPPSKIIDYLALMGDKVDNVPGINKCGPKTAAKWITAYGSLEGVREHSAEVSGKIGEYLREGLDFLPVAEELVTIKTDVELPEVPEISGLCISEPDEGRLEELYRRWEMKTGASRAKKQLARAVKKSAEKSEAPADTGLQMDLFSSLPAPDAANLPESPAAGDDPVPFEIVRTAEDAERCLAALKTLETGTVPAGIEIFADCETPMNARLDALAVAAGPAGAWFIPVTDVLGMRLGTADDVLRTLKPWFEGPAKKVSQDAKFLLHVLKNEGIDAANSDAGRIDDTRLMDYVIESHNRHDLEKLSFRWLRRELKTLDDLLGKGAQRKRAFEIPEETFAPEAVNRAAVVRALAARFALKLAEDPGQKLTSIYEEIELPVENVLFRMERTGTLIDSASLGAQSRDLEARIGALQKKAWEEAGEEFNLGSPKQLAHVLFEKLAIPAGKKTATGGYSTGEEVLSALAHTYPLPATVLQYRALSKLKSTYTDKLPKMIFPGDGRVHTTFGQATAVTGRLASSDPNLQNIPARTEEGRKVREAFVAPDGWKIVSADYSQIELRVMAHISGDPGLIDAFMHGRDVHRATASEVFGVPLEEVTPDQRRMAKVINFGLIYGMSAFGLSQNLGIERRTAAAYIERYFERYPKVKEYMEKTRESAHKLGYVETAFGRRLWLPDIQSSRAPVRAGAERQAINAPMQGTAADLIKIAMVAVDRWLCESGLRSRMVLQVHDELVLESPEDEVDLVKEKLPLLMASAAKLSVPLIASVGAAANWEAAH